MSLSILDSSLLTMDLIRVLRTRRVPVGVFACPPCSPPMVRLFSEIFRCLTGLPGSYPPRDSSISSTDAPVFLKPSWPAFVAIIRKVGWCFHERKGLGWIGNLTDNSLGPVSLVGFLSGSIIPAERSGASIVTSVDTKKFRRSMRTLLDTCRKSWGPTFKSWPLKHLN